MELWETFPRTNAWYDQAVPGIGEVYNKIGRGIVLAKGDVFAIGAVLRQKAGTRLKAGAYRAGRGIARGAGSLLHKGFGLGAGAFVGRAVTGSGVGATLGAGMGLGIAMGYGPAMAKGLWSGVKRVPGLYHSRAVWMGTGAALGGMLAGPAGVVPGAILGAAGGKAVARSGWGAARGIMGSMARNPRKAGLLIGAVLSIPTLAQTTHDLFSPTVKPPNFAFAHPNAQYGMDPDNLNTQGLTLALHYRR